MYRSTMPLSHRPRRDGSAVDVAHVPAYLALELAGQAWADALASASANAFTETDVMIVSISSDFSAELLVGSADVEVRVVSVGRSSFVVEVRISQNEQQAAQVRFTLVRVVDGKSLPLSDAQRVSVSSLMSASPAQV